jgi:hypothetical protein
MTSEKKIKEITERTWFYACDIPGRCVRQHGTTMVQNHAIMIQFNWTGYHDKFSLSLWKQIPGQYTKIRYNRILFLKVGWV